jgi:hypothetical protein
MSIDDTHSSMYHWTRSMEPTSSRALSFFVFAFCLAFRRLSCSIMMVEAHRVVLIGALLSSVILSFSYWRAPSSSVSRHLHPPISDLILHCSGHHSSHHRSFFFPFTHYIKCQDDLHTVGYYDGHSYCSRRLPRSCGP